MTAVDLELTLRSAGTTYHAEARCRAPGSDAPIDAAATVQIDPARLRELTLDPAAYGLALGRMVLVQAISRAVDQARVAAQRANVPLRLRLIVPPELHQLRWETLRDPAHPDAPFLTMGGQILFSRSLSSADWTPVQPRSLGGRRALVLLASPSDLADYGLAPFDVDAERAIIEQSLAPIPTTVLGSGQAILGALVEALRSGPDILYLMAHGRVDTAGETWLYLEGADEKTAPVRGSEVAARIAEQAVRPRLVILGSCESAGDGHGAALLTLGPLLARAGVSAVLAMQGTVTLETLRTFLPACLRALIEGGRIDAAVSHARGLVRDRADFWAPVLFLRLLSGRLWGSEQNDRGDGDDAGQGSDNREGNFISGGTFHGDVIGKQVVLPPASEPLKALHQLRAPVADFVGREEVVAKLVTALRTAPGCQAAAISGVRGMGGIGKTELAYAVAAQLGADYPDAQLVLELRGASHAPLSPAQALQRVIGAFRPAEKLPEELGALQAIYRSVLAGLRVLILADDAKDAAQVRPLLPPVGCALLVTSRQRLLLDGMMVFDLERFDEVAAVQLLRGICGRLDEEPARQIARLCGYLPLALRVSAGILANDDSLLVKRYLTQLADERHRLAQLRDPDDPARDVAATLHLSYAALNQSSQTLLRHLGVLVADANLGLIAAMLKQREEDAEKVLRLLLRHSFVEYDTTRERWSLHDLVRVFALERLGEAGEERTARLRYAEQVIRLLDQANRRYQSGGEGVLEGLACFDQERGHREAVREWLWAQPSAPNIDKLICDEAFATVSIEELRDPVQVVRIPRWTQAVTAARKRGDRQAEGSALSNLGIAYAELGQEHISISYYEQHLAIAREIGDRRGEGNGLGNLGIAYWALGETCIAINYYEQHLAIAREMGDRRGEGRVLGNLGNAYWVLGETRKAINYYEQHLSIAREVGDRAGEGRVLGNLGAAYADLGEVRTAITFFEQDLIITREVGDRYGEGTTLGNLGNAYLGLGEAQMAISYYKQCLTIAYEMSDRHREGNVLDALGSTHYLLGNLAEALFYCQEAYALAQDIRDRPLEGVVLRDLANVQTALGHQDEADANYTKSIAILEESSDLGEATYTRWTYGQFLVRQGERERGTALMAECVAYEQRIGHAQAEEHAALVEHLRSGGELPA